MTDLGKVMAMYINKTTSSYASTRNCQVKHKDYFYSEFLLKTHKESFCSKFRILQMWVGAVCKYIHDAYIDYCREFIVFLVSILQHGKLGYHSPFHEGLTRARQLILLTTRVYMHQKLRESMPPCDHSNHLRSWRSVYAKVLKTVHCQHHFHPQHQIE